MDPVFEKFTTHSKNALKNAFSLALSLGHKAITPQHILYGLSKEKGSIAKQILTKVKIDSEEIKNNVAGDQTKHATITQVGISLPTKRLIEKAFVIANSNLHQYIGTEHLLASLLSLKDEPIEKFFNIKNIDTGEIKKQVETILSSTSKFPDLSSALNYFENGSGHTEDQLDGFSEVKVKSNEPPSVLEIFATNLTQSAIRGEIDPVIGRHQEIERLIQILARRNKNNPLLLGDPGVGKTAIVEGLAQKIATGDVPEALLDKKIYTLDLSSVVAGTSFRGEFENRLKQIINEVRKNPNIILFIDEFHNIVGAGSATGSMDAANILKPALARGQIRCIGATTTEDYKKHIESDPALERRFQPIYVDQPNIEKTIEILKGVKTNYEIFHQVKISPDALEAAAHLSERYIPDRFLPDKAIDLIDEAASAIKIKQAIDPLTKEIKELEKTLRDIEDKKQKSVAKEKFNAALKFRKKEYEIISKIKELKEKSLNQESKALAEITNKEIAEIVSRITGIPMTNLMLQEKTQLLKLEKELAKKIIFQQHAIDNISEFIRRSRTGITDARRPIGSFIFLGPSGVGKTELARVLASTVFGSPDNLVKIDMSEFTESFNISKLIGAPAGYVGYKEGTKLTDSVKRRPYSVVLFDEIEKAHPQIFHLMLQILEDGNLTDGTGKKINFRNTIIIMTSNLGSEHFNRQAALGFQGTSEDKKVELDQKFKEIEQNVLEKLKNKFPPEFLSRIDKTIVFKPLDEQAMTKIAQLQLTELKNRLAAQGIKITFKPKVAKTLAKLSYSPETGARSIRKTIQELIESRLAKKILENNNTKEIAIEVKNNEIVL